VALPCCGYLPSDRLSRQAQKLDVDGKTRLLSRVDAVPQSSCASADPAEEGGHSRNEPLSGAAPAGGRPAPTSSCLIKEGIILKLQWKAGNRRRLMLLSVAVCACAVAAGTSYGAPAK